MHHHSKGTHLIKVTLRGFWSKQPLYTLKEDNQKKCYILLSKVMTLKEEITTNHLSRIKRNLRLKY